MFSMHKTIPILLSFFCLLGAASGTLRDPTAPSDGTDMPYSVGQANGLQGYVLSSVIVSPTRKIAVINHKSVREGDYIGGKRVVKISRDGVLLQGQGEENPQLLKMWTRGVKNVK